MRPVVRGKIPKDSKGNDKIYSQYSQARGALIQRLGEYCSYCEMQLDTSLAVEHVQPKQPPGQQAVLAERELDWDNFLLACTNCNSTKSNDEVELSHFIWPDRDNTYRALTYSEGGRVSASEQIDPLTRTKANALIRLVGLEKTPSVASTASDRRWMNRREAWDIANRAKERLTRNDNLDLREQVVDTAEAKGFWSIWMTVFQDDSDMCGRLLRAFNGTSEQCFDSLNDYTPVARQGGCC